MLPHQLVILRPAKRCNSPLPMCSCDYLQFTVVILSLRHHRAARIHAAHLLSPAALFAGLAVRQLAEDVGMAVVSRRLFDHVDEDATQRVGTLRADRQHVG